MKIFVYVMFRLGMEYRIVEMLILAVPVVGVVLYDIMGHSRLSRQVRHRYESAVTVCGDLMKQIKKDCGETFSKCRRITDDWLRRQNIFVRLLSGVLKPLAPLL